MLVVSRYCVATFVGKKKAVERHCWYVWISTYVYVMNKERLLELNNPVLLAVLDFRHAFNVFEIF